MSFFSINALAPVIRQSSDSFNQRLEPETESYAISVERGFETANLSLRGDIEFLKDWFDNGLARDITFVGPDGKTAWNGFVNQMALTDGGTKITHGLDNMANRVIFSYTELDTATNPPGETEGASVTKNDTTSQGLFGIKMRIIDGGKATVTNADVAALTELTRLAFPLAGETVKIGGGSEPRLSFSLRGYAFMGDWYNYSQSAVSGTDTATNIIVTILAADPNSVLSASTLLIETNSTATEQFWEDEGAWKIIRKIIKRGSSSAGVGIPWAGGIYESRRLTLKRQERLDTNNNPVSTNQFPLLFRSDIDPAIITDEAGAEVPLWHLRPDRLLVNERLGRTLYVRRVNFKPPLGLTLSGNEDVFSLANLV
jgi:hypothetical protein